MSIRLAGLASTGVFTVDSAIDHALVFGLPFGRGADLDRANRDKGKKRPKAKCGGAEGQAEATPPVGGRV